MVDKMKCGIMYLGLLLLLVPNHIFANSFNVKQGQRVLFIDNVAVEKIQNLTRTMHTPRKRGALIRPRADLGLRVIQIRSAPVWDPQKKVYRLWDVATPAELHIREIYTGGYNESRDGLHWYQPDVGQFEFRGSYNNNLVSVTIAGKHFRPDCVVYDPHENNPDKRFKGLSFSCPTTNTAIQSGRVLTPVASDGKTWKPIEGESLATSDEHNLSYDAEEKEFIATVKIGGPYGRSVGLYTSKDFKHWKSYGLVFHADEKDQTLGREIIKDRFDDPELQHPVFNNPQDYNVDVYNMGVFRYENIYIGLPSMFYSTGKNEAGNNKDGFHHVQLACSRDLKHWTRLGNRKPFLGPSPLGAGAYDLTQIIAPSSPVYHGDELWFYYSGAKYRNPPENADNDEGAVCLAVLRRDGFISLDANSRGGWVKTKPFTPPDGELYVNVNASGGSATVTVLDNQGRLIKGFEQSKPITTDAPRAKVNWPNAEYKSLAGQTIRLMIRLQDAQLYSFWMNTEDHD